MDLTTIEGSWTGSGELWLDPLGNEASTCDVVATCDGTTFVYEWSHDGTDHEGSFVPGDDGAVLWSDTFHQPDGSQCAIVPDAWGLLTAEHEYTVPKYGTWRWRTRFCVRPDDTLVVQMTNIAPWGEEGRAVRMTLSERS